MRPSTRTQFAATCLAMFLASCSSERSPERGGAGVLPRPPDIVLVTIDTLRADHLGCYGYFRETSPSIDALAAEGLLFERAVSTSGTTLPAHLSLFTGLYVHQHGYVSNATALHGAFSSSPGRRSAADVLRDAGYTTAAFVSGPTVGSHTGLDSGFDHFDQHVQKDQLDVFDHSRRAGETNQRVFEWLAKDPPRPFFLWVHYWDPHEPNAPLEPYASLFRADERVERLIDERRIDPALLRERFSDLELARLFAPELLRDLHARERGDLPEGHELSLPPIDRDAIRGLIDNYDGDVRYVDDRLGELFAQLEARGRWAGSIVVVTSDHGQALGQRDWLEHGRIELENTHVPLVIRLPDGLLPQPQRIADVVSHVDVLPTVVARIGGAAAKEFLAQAEGRDLLSGRFDRPHSFSQRSTRPREWRPGEPRENLEFALTLKEWRYYHRTHVPDSLYHLPSDPGELHDVLEAQPELARRLEALVREIIARKGHELDGAAASDAAEEFRRMLKNLGYADE